MKASEQINIGDCVKLLSGSPAMTIITFDLNNNQVTVKWFDNSLSDFKIAIFPKEALFNVT